MFTRIKANLQRNDSHLNGKTVTTSETLYTGLQQIFIKCINFKSEDEDY